MSATVFERRYVLKPERGGVVRLPGAGATLWDTLTFSRCRIASQLALLSTRFIRDATSLHEAPEMSASLAARSVNFLAARSVRTVVRKQAVAKTAVHSTRRTLTVSTRAMGAKIPEGDHFTMADQPARFAKGKADNSSRMLTTDYYDGTFLRGQRVLVTGGNRGIGLALVQELVDCGADVVASG